MKAFSDDRLIQREFYNPNSFDVIVTRDKNFDSYVIQHKGHGSLGPEKTLLKADDFLYLPHGFFVVTNPKMPVGEPINILVNLEKNMFKRNKTPSNVYGMGE